MELTIANQELKCNVDLVRQAVDSIKHEGIVDYARVLEIRTIKDVLKLSGNKPVRIILIASLQLVNARLNIKNKMNEEQLLLAVDSIIEEYAHTNMRVPELVYVINDLPKGTFGKVYERVDEAFVFECLKNYEKQRAEHLQKYFAEKNKREAIERETQKQREWEQYLMNRTPEQVAREKEMMDNFKSKLKSLSNAFKPKPIAEVMPISPKIKELAERTKVYLEHKKEQDRQAEIARWDGRCFEG